jgi:RimJ/RimL family protein N-acetyltransferase
VSTAAEKAPGPVAYRIETARLVLRCYSPADAPARREAVITSREHLLPYMGWAKEEPRPVEAHVALLRRFRGMFDLDQERFYGVFDVEEQRVLGEVGLLTRAGKGARELAYWVRADVAGKGFATEMTGAVARVCFEVEGLQRLDILVDVGHDRSAAVARRLGFQFEGTLRGRQYPSDEHPVDVQSFSLLEREFSTSPAAKMEVRAFDVLGARLL